MPAGRAFVDSNVLLYLFSADANKADRAEAIVQTGTTINIQVLNEITNVARRKMAMSWAEVNVMQAAVRALCQVESLTLEVHDHGRLLAQRYGFSVYDAMIVAAALAAGCQTLYSEDMQAGLQVDNRMRILNPFS